MDLAKSIEPVSGLKARSAELIRQAQETGQPIIITQNGKATAVLQDIESYQRDREALLLLKFLARGEQELRDGRGVAHASVTEHFQQRLRELKSE